MGRLIRKSIIYHSGLILSLFLLSTCNSSEENIPSWIFILAGGGNGGTPPALHYSDSPYSLPFGMTISPIIPNLSGTPPENCGSTPPLPSGLDIDTATCEISGKPTVLQPGIAYTITATNGYGSGNDTINIAIGYAPTLVYTGSPYIFPPNDAIVTIQPVLAGTPLTDCGVSPVLPAGLSIDTATCEIYGTPTTIQSTTTYTITATNGYGSESYQISIAINYAPSIDYPGTLYNFPLNKAIKTATPTLSGTPITDCEASPALPAGLSIDTETCEIYGTPLAAQEATEYTITATNDYGSGSDTINIAIGYAPVISYTGSPYHFPPDETIVAIVPGITGTPLVDCGTTPSLPAGLSINASTCEISGTPTTVQEATEYTITATNIYGSGSGTVSIAIGNTPTLNFANSPFSFTPDVTIATIVPDLTGTPLVDCNASPPLPTGLSVNASTCEISGTPTAIQDATEYTITATNGYGNGSDTISIAIGFLPALDFTEPAYYFHPNEAITTIVPALTGTPLTDCSASPALPPGLSIDATTCEISGAPTAIQDATEYTITATNGFGSADDTIIIAIDESPTIGYQNTNYVFSQGEAISTIVPTVTGTPLTGCSVSPALPAGLSIDTTSCEIYGTPTELQDATEFTVIATNTYGEGQANINIAIIDSTAPIVISTIPDSGSANVAPNSGTITVVFNEAMNTMLIPLLTTKSLDAYGSQIPNEGTVIVWTDPQTLTMNLSWVQFPENTIIQWTLNAENLRDVSGNAIAADVQGGFMTTSRNTYFPIADTGQSNCYSDSGVISCGDSSWPFQDADFIDIPNARSFTGPTQHPIHTGNYITTDNVTGLVWKTCSEGLSGAFCETGSATTVDWPTSLNQCATLNTANGGAGYAGRTNWRLPSRAELESLPDYGTSNTVKIDETAFPTTLAGSYWSASMDWADPVAKTDAYSVFFDNGKVELTDLTGKYYVHCVSGGP